MTSILSPSSASRATAHCLGYYPSPTGPSSLFEDLPDIDIADSFLQQKQRAGGPYLCSLPAIHTPLLPQTYQPHQKLLDESWKLTASIEDILNKEGISYEFVSITGRQSKVDPEPQAIPTVWVVATRQNESEDWRKVSRKIHSFISQFLSGISVEIIDQELDKLPRCSPILVSDSIFDKWPAIRQAILDRSDISEWTGLECWRYGRDSNTQNNPPTIIVSVQKHTAHFFHAAKQHLKTILLEFEEPEVAILFMKDELSLCCERTQVPLEACQGKTIPGVGLSIHDSTANTSTLGGIVELRFEGENEWQPFGLTCFHSVYPPDKHRQQLDQLLGAHAAFDEWLFNPVLLTDKRAQSILQVNHPSSCDIEEDITSWKQRIARLRDARFVELEGMMEELDVESQEACFSQRDRYIYHLKKHTIANFEDLKSSFEAFYNNNGFQLGFVYAGSGLNRVLGEASQRTLSDWALVTIKENRLGENKVCVKAPRTENMSLTGICISIQPFHYSHSQPLVIRFHEPWENNMHQVSTLHKVGRSSGYSKGEYSKLKQVRIARVRDSDGTVRTAVTLEHSVSSSPISTFCVSGDSGSFIFDDDGGVVGLLYGGSERNDVAYFTHIHDFFEDVKAITGAVDVRIGQM